MATMLAGVAQFERDLLNERVKSGLADARARGKNLPSTGIRKMGSWKRFCTFAREPETRKVAGDAHIRVDGAFYEAPVPP